MKTVQFNPSSRQHIAHCLKAKYNWSPKEFTESGQAKIDDEVLNSLVYPEAKKLAEQARKQAESKGWQSMAIKFSSMKGKK